MDNAQYELNEHREFIAQLTRVEKQALRDRQESREELRDTLHQQKRDLLRDGVELIIERASWLIDGCYGYGAMKAFQNLTTRMNRRAWLFNTIASLEWMCPQKFASELWNKLDPVTQEQINSGLDRLIEEYEANK